MAISNVGGQSSFAIQRLMNMRAQFDELQRQLSTGMKSKSYAGLGLERGVTVSLNAQLSAIGGYNSTINNVATRLSVSQSALARMSEIGSSVRLAMAQAGFGTNGSGAGTAQKTAQYSLDEMLGLLNAQAGERYLFAGRITDKPAVDSYDHILNGDGARAGLKQLISERKQADLGASGLGRLAITSPTATSIEVAEDAVSPFGFKLASANSTLTNGTVSAPIGSPASLTISLTGVPNAGDSVTLRFNLPDGSSENLTLTATTNSPPGENEFTIGANATDTTANLQASLTTAIGKLAATSLTAASAVAASNEFFNADSANPPMRVDGPPFDSATAMIAGTTANSVVWYTGEIGSDLARTTASARIDQGLVVAYGVRANEEGIRTLVKNIATLAVVNVTPGDPNAPALSAALNGRLTASLNGTAGGQTIVEIQSELAGAQVSLNAAKQRHQQTTATLGDFLDQIQGVSNEEVGSQLLALQTRMQASMQVTSMLYQTSLINYIK